MRWLLHRQWLQFNMNLRERNGNSPNTLCNCAVKTCLICNSLTLVMVSANTGILQDNSLWGEKKKKYVIFFCLLRIEAKLSAYLNFSF